VWQLAGWGTGAGRGALGAGAAGLLILGTRFGTRFKPRRITARARTLVRNITKRIPIRNRLLLAVYRVLTFRLVHLTMGDAVAALGPEVIHAHDLQTLPAGARLAKTLNASLVYDSHELATHVSTRPPLFFRLWMGWKERRSIPVADRVLTVSVGIAEHLERRYRIRRPDLVFNSPPTTMGDAPRTVRDDLGLRRDVPLALYVGALTGNRGLEQTVDTLPLLPEFHLACVGPRQPEWEADMLARARKSGTEERLHFVDPVPIEMLIGYLSTADVGVIAIQNITLSYWFTMPNKLFETVLAGVPVVVADLPHLREFVEQNGVGVVADQTDPAAIADGVRRVMAHPELRPTPDHLTRLREEYGWESQARRLVDIYADVSGSRRARAEVE
jgi:glycosyltransferase involved in cell wall biosynthesis